MINAPKKAEAAALGCPVEDKIDRVHAKRELIRKLKVFFGGIIQQRSDDKYSKYMNAYPSKDYKSARKKGRCRTQFIKARSKKVFLLGGKKMVSWYTFLAYNNVDDETRVKMWHNSARHFIGDNSFCPHVITKKPKVGRPSKTTAKEEFW